MAMNYIRLILIAGAVAAAPHAATLAQEGDEVLDKLSQYERTGESKACLPLRRIKDTKVIDDGTLLIEVSGGEMYLNELRGRCIGLKSEERFVHQSSLSQMCRGDIIRVLDSFGNERGGCGLGNFEKLSKIENTDS